MTNEQKAILKRAIDHYGIDAQLTKTIEELAELTKEICKLKEAGNTFYSIKAMRTRENLLEEKADCYIMLMQLDLFFGDSLAYIDAKIARLKERMDDDDKNHSTRNPTKQ